MIASHASVAEHARALRSSAAACVATSIALLAPGLACAGPPFLTDDPQPTDTGHWEIYAPQADAGGTRAEFDGTFGAELNFGAAPNLQLTLGLPAAFTRTTAEFQVGRGDLRLAAKYRFYHDEVAGLAVAAFPGVMLPTASAGFGAHHLTALLPAWAQKDVGPWSVFGGGGYAINPGPGNRDYWTCGAAVARSLGTRLLVGVEADRQGADADGGQPSTSIGLGAIVVLDTHVRLLASGGPTYVDRGGPTGFHAYLALGLVF